MHAAPTEDQAADRLLCQFVQMALGLSHPGSQLATTAAEVTSWGGFSSLVLISCDHGFVPMLTRARRAGVMTTLILPVGYKQHTIHIQGECSGIVTK